MSDSIAKDSLANGKVEDEYLDSLFKKHSKDPSKNGFESDASISAVKESQSPKLCALTEPYKKNQVLEKYRAEKTKRSALLSRNWRRN